MILTVPKDSEIYHTPLDLAAISHVPAKLMANSKNFYPPTESTCNHY